jgi:ABC-type nitrate/sulfonate/bicarbonate transport system permease component
MYAMIFLVGVVGVVLNVIVRRVERRFLFWHPSQRLGVPA